MTAIIDDTYAEAFKSMYSEVLITAINRKWLDHAVNAATGNASSSILCDCEAGLDRYVGPGGDESVSTPDGRPGAIIQLHIPKFWKELCKMKSKINPRGDLFSPKGSKNLVPQSTGSVLEPTFFSGIGFLTHFGSALAPF